MLSGKVGVSMSATTQFSWIPTPLPGQDELPYDDGEPMETPKHRQQMNLLIESLSRYLCYRSDVFVGGNMAVYYSQLQIRQNDFRAPDFFVAIGTPVQRERKSWVVWEEGGKMPDVVIELLSESTEAVDRGVKMDIYARIMGVMEYYLYDPLTAQLEGYLLDPTRRYRRMIPAEDGSVPCQLLGLRLAVRPGAYQLVEGLWLRWVDPKGDTVPHDGERADAEAQRAETESRRAETESRRAAAMAERLAEYERRFGVLP